MIKEHIYAPNTEKIIKYVKAQTEPDFDSIKGKQVENLLLHALQHYGILTAHNMAHYISFKEKRRTIKKMDDIISSMHTDGFTDMIIISDQEDNEIMRFYCLSKKSEIYMREKNGRYKAIQNDYTKPSVTLKSSMVAQWQLMTDIVWNKSKSAVDNSIELHNFNILIPSYSLVEKDEIRHHVCVYPVLPERENVEQIFNSIAEIEAIKDRFTSPREKYIIILLVPNESDLDKLLYLCSQNNRNVFIAIAREVVEINGAPIVYALNTEGKKITYELTM